MMRLQFYVLLYSVHTSVLIRPVSAVFPSSAHVAQVAKHGVAVDGELHNATVMFDCEPRESDGNPWFRYKPTKFRGSAAHEDFGGFPSGGTFAADLLRAHNIVRRKVGLRLLEWSIALQDLAERRLAALTPSCYIRHRPVSQLLSRAGFEFIGENLYKVIGFEPTGIDVADAWYAEKEDYVYGYVGEECTKGCKGRASPPCIVGHFTQMLWESTSAIGCMVSKCSSKRKTYISVCYYGPGGNVVGSAPFSAAVAKRLGHAEVCHQE